MEALISSSLIAFLAIGVHAEQEPRPWLRTIEMPFDTHGYKFSSDVKDVPTDPIEASLRLFAEKDGKRTLIEKTSQLEGIVTLKTADEALAFARLFTDDKTRFLFKDTAIIEVYSKTASQKHVEETGNALASHEKCGFSPKVSIAETGFIIERCLLNNRNTLFRSHEEISSGGRYRMTVKSMLEKRSRLHFPFYE